MSISYVHTLGDSTLDNLYWMLNRDGSNAAQAKELSVEGQLQKKLNSGNPLQYQVVSHAYDGFTTSSVLNGDDVGRVLAIQPGQSQTRMKTAYLADKSISPTSFRYYIHPLNNLKGFIEANSRATHYVVISVGGNDFRERLGNPLEMLREIPHIHERYLKIVKEVKSIKDRDIRPILMFQYCVDAHHDHYQIYAIAKVIGQIFVAIHSISLLGMAVSALVVLTQRIHAAAGLVFFLISATSLALSHLVMPLNATINILMGKDASMAALEGLMETFYSPILKQARADGISILDLPHTFNPHDSSLYVSQIEPSQKGAQLIAEGIDHIVKHHNFSSPKSMIYSKRDTEAAFTGIET